MWRKPRPLSLLFLASLVIVLGIPAPALAVQSAKYQPPYPNPPFMAASGITVQCASVGATCTVLQDTVSLNGTAPLRGQVKLEQAVPTTGTGFIQWRGNHVVTTSSNDAKAVRADFWYSSPQRTTTTTAPAAGMVGASVDYTGSAWCSGPDWCFTSGFPAMHNEQWLVLSGRVWAPDKTTLGRQTLTFASYFSATAKLGCPVDLPFPPGYVNETCDLVAEPRWGTAEAGLSTHLAHVVVCYNTTSMCPDPRRRS